MSLERLEFLGRQIGLDYYHSNSSEHHVWPVNGNCLHTSSDNNEWVCKYKCYHVKRNCSTTIKAMFIKETKEEWCWPSTELLERWRMLNPSCLHLLDSLMRSCSHRVRLWLWGSSAPLFSDIITSEMRLNMKD